MKNTTMTTMQSLRLLLSGAMAALLLAAAGGAHAQAYVNATVGGELAPGVYGRINIGNAPPPPLIYAEPVIIHRPAVVVPRSPIYLYVPPGHAKNWGKHCGRYNACNQPVYFVNGGRPHPNAYAPTPRRDDHRMDRRDDRRDNRWDDRRDRHDDRGHPGKGKDKDRGHGNGKGHGHR